MNEREDLPEEVQCFICMKTLKDYKLLALDIHCKDSDIVATVAICADDLVWIAENPDAGTAICQSRLEAIVHKHDKE